MTEFVVNEWLPEYFRPTASTENKRKLFRFLTALLNRIDTRIVMRRPSPFLDKVYRMPKDYQNDPLALRPLKVFIGGILENPAKCRFVDDEEFSALPDELIDLLSIGNYSSDTYLFEAAASTNAPLLIVTTDVKLVNHLTDYSDCQLVLLDEFLTTFAS